MKAYLAKQKNRLITLVSKELSAQKIAMALTFGLVFGIVPMFCGLNIALSLLVAWRFKLNHLLVQLISNIVYPLQIILFVPFIKLGIYMFSREEALFSASLIYSVFKENVLDGLRLLGIWNLYAVFCWLIIMIPTFYIMYHLVLFVMVKYKLLPARVLLIERKRTNKKAFSF